MPSTVVDPIAEALADVADTVAAGATTVKGFKWAPKSGDVGRGPAAVVYTPAIERTGADEAESRLGAEDWRLDYPVLFYFHADDAGRAQAQVAEVVEGFIKAVDAAMDTPGSDLTGLGVVDAKVTRAEEPEPAEIKNRPMLQVETRVEVLTFV